MCAKFMRALVYVLLSMKYVRMYASPGGGVCIVVSVRGTLRYFHSDADNSRPQIPIYTHIYACEHTNTSFSFSFPYLILFSLHTYRRMCRALSIRDSMMSNVWLSQLECVCICVLQRHATTFVVLLLPRCTLLLSNAFLFAPSICETKMLKTRRV